MIISSNHCVEQHPFLKALKAPDHHDDLQVKKSTAANELYRYDTDKIDTESIRPEFPGQLIDRSAFLLVTCLCYVEGTQPDT